MYRSKVTISFSDLDKNKLGGCPEIRTDVLKQNQMQSMTVKKVKIITIGVPKRNTVHMACVENKTWNSKINNLTWKWDFCLFRFWSSVRSGFRVFAQKLFSFSDLISTTFFGFFSFRIFYVTSECFRFCGSHIFSFDVNFSRFVLFYNVA